MNIKQIRELAQILRANELSSLEITEGEMCIRMERGLPADPAAQPAMETAAAIPASEEEQKDAGVDFNRLMQVKSPLVGVFYAAPLPDAEPFVKVGDSVKKGDTLCIVEAMKLMNEIVAEADGVIVDVCANNGDVVEFGQTLFKLN